MAGVLLGYGSQTLGNHCWWLVAAAAAAVQAAVPLMQLQVRMEMLAEGQAVAAVAA
jgi:hypothetical protein